MRWHIRYSSLISIRMHSQQLFFFLPTNDENKIFPFVDNAITAQCSCIALPFIRSHQPFASYFALQSPCADLRSALYFPFFANVNTYFVKYAHSQWKLLSFCFFQLAFAFIFVHLSQRYFAFELSFKFVKMVN